MPPAVSLFWPTLVVSLLALGSSVWPAFYSEELLPYRIAWPVYMLGSRPWTDDCSGETSGNNCNMDHVLHILASQGKVAEDRSGEENAGSGKRFSVLFNTLSQTGFTLEHPAIHPPSVLGSGEPVTCPSQQRPQAWGTPWPACQLPSTILFHYHNYTQSSLGSEAGQLNN